MRVPPNSVEAEMSLLGALLLDPEAYDEVSTVITPEDFYKEAHRQIYRSMQKIAGRQEVIDVVTLTQQLADEKVLDSVGGLPYVAGLSSSVPTAANVAYYANIVYKKSVLRRTISVANEIAEECYGDVEDISTFLNQSESKLMALADQRSSTRVRSLKDIVKDTYYQIEALYEREEKITGVPSGFLDLDDKTAGWQDSDLVIIAARPAMGKCLTGDAELVGPDGRLRRLDALVAARDGQLLTLDADRRLSFTSPSAFVDDGLKPTFEVITGLGRRVESTAPHPFLTPEGWRPLGELSVGDFVAVPRRLPVCGASEPAAARVALLAALLAPEACFDGDLSRLDGEAAEVARDALEALGWSAAGALDHLRLAGVAPRERALPDELFAWSRAALGRWFEQALSLHGDLDAPPGGAALRLPAERAARHLQHLALRLGVVLKLEAADGDSWRLVTIHGGLREALAPEAAPISGCDILWDPIVSITPTGLKPVYDLTVPETHNFVANDICVHNTAFTLNMACNAAVRFNRSVLFCSLEMSANQLAMRLLASEARVDVSRIRTGSLKEHEWRRLINATATLSKAPIFIDDTPALSVQTLFSQARRLKVDHGLDIIMIDYLQLMSTTTPGITSRENIISDISRTLKIIAKDLNVPVLALAQLNRGVESRADKRPMLSDLRECVTGETLVTLADGRRVPIAELVGQQPRVLAVDDQTMTVVEATSDKVWCVGTRPILRLTLAGGATLRATARHRLLTPDGWMMLGDCGPGQRLAVAADPSQEGRTTQKSAPTPENPEKFGVEGLGTLARSRVFWDEIISVVPDGQEPVYDLTVPGPASWLADTIVSHNSGAIEQDADIISFVYRDEYYNEDSEAKGQAEIILGKHRSGSTGTVHLRFFPEFTRFENLAREDEEGAAPG